MTTLVTRVTRDLRSLGATAPVRAAYEFSKRSGLHHLLFSAAGRRRELVPHRLDLSRTESLSAAGDAAVLADAGAVLGEGARVFGKRVATGVSASWLEDPESGKAWPGNTPWWKIDIRTDARLGDVKHVWEAARHRDLVILARAARLEPDGAWAKALGDMLDSWCEQNPPERGVNWYSSLELAIRAIAWAQVLQLAGEQLSSVTKAAMARHLQASGRHIVVELPYTLSSMRNNHMLGDALGLLVLARLFPDHPAVARWTSAGNRLFDAQLARHMRPDGSMIEDSLSYHRFVMEMLIVRVLLGDAPDAVRESLRASSMHLARLGVFDGDVPQFGDWDEGRILSASRDPLGVSGTVALGLHLSGVEVPDDWFDRYDELAWYGRNRSESIDAAGAALTFTASSSGGIAYSRTGPWRVWLKAGAGPSHGHADLASVWIQHDGEWLLIDPGTGTYNGPLSVRDGFRTSRAHSVVRLENEDQLQPHRAFRWLTRANGYVSPVASVDSTQVMFGWHDAYERLFPGTRVGKIVVVDVDGVTVVDVVRRLQDSVNWRMTLPLSPAVTWTTQGELSYASTVLPTSGLDRAAPATGEEAHFDGWFSDTYGSWSPTTWLEMPGSDWATAWRIGTGGVMEVVSDTEFRCGRLAISLDWESQSVTVRTDDAIRAVLRA